MDSARNIFLYAFLVLLTVCYCWLIYLGMSAFLIITSNMELPSISIILSLHPFVWQALAVVSLLANSAWAFFISKKDAKQKAHIRAALNHVIWILLSTMLHCIGMLEAVVITTYIIK